MDLCIIQIVWLARSLLCTHLLFTPSNIVGSRIIKKTCIFQLSFINRAHHATFIFVLLRSYSILLAEYTALLYLRIARYFFSLLPMYRTSCYCTHNAHSRTISGQNFHIHFEYCTYVQHTSIILVFMLCNPYDRQNIYVHYITHTSIYMYIPPLNAKYIFHIFRC